jgi:cyclopropane fatty-acyl-phospholipid synthase-like methyltransferase
MRALSQTRPVLTHSQACERNKGPILRVLAGALAASATVLEIGSGSGQHAVHFAGHLAHLTWQPSELGAQLAPLAERVHLQGPPNLKSPIELDIRQLPWAVPRVDAVFSANTLHIVAWQAVEDFFRGVGAVLCAPGVLCVYGPFRYGGRYTSDSNAEFDRYLKERDAASGIRDFEALEALAQAQGLSLAGDYAMPANNQTLVWHRP